LVEIEVRKTEPETQTVAKTNLDINEIMRRVRDFVGSIREMSTSKDEAMMVSLDAFNFSIGKKGDMYDLSIKLNLGFKPKQAVNVA
jgi:hypothetical protein